MTTSSKEQELFQWPQAKPGHTIVKLKECVNGEPPLIILPGGGGATYAFNPLKEKFTTGLWAIQVTPDTPLDSYDNHIEHYFKKIKEQLPHGPYRLASFSSGSIVVYGLALRFEAAGDKIVQLVNIDHFPLLFLRPPVGLDPENDDLDNKRLFQRVCIDDVCEMTRRDGGGTNSRRIQLANALIEAFNGSPPSHFSKHYWRALEPFLNLLLDHIRTLPTRMKPHLSPSIDSLSRGEVLMESMLAWLRSIKATPTVYVCSYGMQGLLPAGLKEEGWRDLGVRKAFPGAKIVYFDAGHFDVLANDVLINSLQEGYFPSQHLDAPIRIRPKL